MIEAHLEETTRDFNLDLLRGTEVNTETLASVIATPPMMAEWRVVVVREVEGLASSKHARDELVRIAKDPPPGLALIMSCTVPVGSKAKFYTSLAKVARSTEFQAISDADVPGWIMHRSKTEHEVEFSPEAARALGVAIGNNLGVLSQELTKLADFVGDRRRVVVEDVEAAGTTLPSQDRWKWFDLVGERRFEEAAKTLHILLQQGDNGVGLVIGLATHFLRLGISLEEGSEGLERALPRHQQWLASRVVSQARGWTSDEIDEALASLLDVDQLLKASPHTDEHFLEAWILSVQVRAEVM